MLELGLEVGTPALTCADRLQDRRQRFAGTQRLDKPLELTLNPTELALKAFAACVEPAVLRRGQLHGPGHDVVDQVGGQHVLAERLQDRRVERRQREGPGVGTGPVDAPAVADVVVA